MNLEVQGSLCFIGDTVTVSEKFKKREFVIEMIEAASGRTFSNFAKFQCTQAKCDILNNFRTGEEVVVKFNIRGNRWERDGKANYITNLDAWRIERAQGQQQAAAQNYTPAAPPSPNPEIIDDLPF